MVITLLVCSVVALTAAVACVLVFSLNTRRELAKTQETLRLLQRIHQQDIMSVVKVS